MVRNLRGGLPYKCDGGDRRNFVKKVPENRARLATSFPGSLVHRVWGGEMRDPGNEAARFVGVARMAHLRPASVSLLSFFFGKRTPGRRLARGATREQFTPFLRHVSDAGGEEGNRRRLHVRLELRVTTSSCNTFKKEVKTDEVSLRCVLRTTTFTSTYNPRCQYS